MTLTPLKRRSPVSVRPSRATRRVGYLVAILVNSVLLSAVNDWPGWQSVPVLTAEFRLVLELVNISITASLLANLIYLVVDPRWLKALGDVVTTAVGLVALFSIWRVFPFSFGADSIWSLVARTVLVVAAVGSVIGIIVALVSLIRSLTTGDESGHNHR